MTPKLKKIIAREVLIVLVSILLSGIPYIIYSLLNSYSDEGVWIGWVIPMYIIVRFSFWAIRTLKEK